MAGNEYKKEKNGKGLNLFKFMENALKFDFIFSEGIPVRFLPKVIYISFLAVLYIAHVHYSDKSTRQLSKLETEVEDLRAYYAALMKEYKFAIIESEMASKLKESKLKESTKPPYKIVKPKK